MQPSGKVLVRGQRCRLGAPTPYFGRESFQRSESWSRQPGPNSFTLGSRPLLSLLRFPWRRATREVWNPGYCILYSCVRKVPGFEHECSATVVMCASTRPLCPEIAESFGNLGLVWPSCVNCLTRIRTLHDWLVIGHKLSASARFEWRRNLLFICSESALIFDGKHLLYESNVNCTFSEKQTIKAKYDLFYS